MASKKTGKPVGRPKGTKQPKTLAREKAAAQLQLELIADARRILQELITLGLVNAQDYVNADGTWKSITDLTKAQSACIASVEMLRRNIESGDGHTDTVLKVKFWDKLKALEMLAKHFGLLVEKLEHSGGYTIRWQGPDEGAPG